jgi:hypothetical protein
MFASTRWRDLFRIAAAIGVVALLVWLARLVFRDAYIAVFGIGALVGLGELVSRYRDAPEHAVRTMPALLYIALNSVAAIAALQLVETFNVIPGKTEGDAISRILLAGFGAMAFFRTSVFTVRVGDQDVSIGPVAFLQIVLHATDRAVDRVRADARAGAVAACMAGVSFDAAKAALPAFCLALMQNVPAEEQQDGPYGHLPRFGWFADPRPSGGVDFRGAGRGPRQCGWPCARFKAVGHGDHDHGRRSRGSRDGFGQLNSAQTSSYLAPRWISCRPLAESSISMAARLRSRSIARPSSTKSRPLSSNAAGSTIGRYWSALRI